MQWYRWLFKLSGLIIVVGALLVIASITERILLPPWSADILVVELIGGRTLRLLGYFGGLLLVIGIGHTVVSPLLQDRRFQAKALLTRTAIYEETKRMVERCTGSEIIRATSISTEYDQSDSVHAYLKTIAVKCGQARREETPLLYKTVFGFGKDSGGVPPAHKQDGIETRRALFRQQGAEDRLVMKYIETNWSLDVLIVGLDEMLIAFPALPEKRQLFLGLKISNPEFVRQAVRWYDDCVLEGAQDVTWLPEPVPARR